MELRIDKKSQIPVRQQLAEQIIFLIATETLKSGEALPSVRELSRRLKIHRNTVSQVYGELKQRAWLVGLRGSRLVVRTAGQQTSADLDDLINATIRIARERGYTLQMLRQRVKTRLQEQPPDRILIVEDEPALRLLLQREVREVLHQPVEGCAIADLANNPSLAIGALAVAPQYAIPDVDPLLPKTNLAVPLVFSGADEHLKLLSQLRQPSVIAVVSVSGVLLKTARSLMAHALGQRHTLCEYSFPLDRGVKLKAADLVFADSIVCPRLKHPNVIRYQLIRPNSLQHLVSTMNSYG
jgi:DNA-binding transcriptional regulator YhcF (GntR family)